nr:PREDICTED: uncharacterized protein LOC108199510 [Daucus carota subsp. sativus]
MFKICTIALRSCISNSRSLSSSTFSKGLQPFAPNHHLSSISRPALKSRHNIHRNLSSYNSSQQGSSSPSGSPLSSWKRWIAGVAVSAITLPQLNSFLEWKNEVEIIVEDAEIIAEVVEKVAEEVAEVADLLDNQLPEGGKLRNAVDVIEDVAKEIVKDTNIAEDILNKVEDFGKEVDSLIAPANDQDFKSVGNETGHFRPLSVGNEASLHRIST